MSTITRSNRSHWAAEAGLVGALVAAVALSLIAATLDLRSSTESAATERATGLDPAPGGPFPVPAEVVEPSVRPEPSVVPQVVGAPQVVPDPRPGDLRVDARADHLPSDYEPPAAATTLLDIAYGSDPAQTLDLYLPANDHAPIVVYLHSGGWVGGDKANVPDMVLRFVERGYAVASVGYRLAPDHPFPAPVHDAKSALRWIKAYGAFGGGVDGDRVVIYGTSAGGHLAAFVAATPGSYEPGPSPLDIFDSSVAGVVAAVGPTDLEAFYGHDHGWAKPLTEAFVGCSPCAAAELAEASPATHVDAAVPPAYFAYGATDGLVDIATQGIALAEVWAEHGGNGSTWFDVVEIGGHSLDHTFINQRALESFVDFAVDRDRSKQ